MNGAIRLQQIAARPLYIGPQVFTVSRSFFEQRFRNYVPYEFSRFWRYGRSSACLSYALEFIPAPRGHIRNTGICPVEQLRIYVSSRFNNSIPILVSAFLLTPWHTQNATIIFRS